LRGAQLLPKAITSIGFQLAKHLSVSHDQIQTESSSTLPPFFLGMLGARLLILGWGEGKGGLSTAYYEFLAFASSLPCRLSVIELSNSQNKSSFPGDHYFRVSSSSRYKKAASLLWIASIMRVWKPTIFLSIGVHKSANHVASVLPGTTYMILQDVTYRECISDPRVKTAIHLFDAIAPQTKSMERIYRQIESKKLYVRSLPCLAPDVDKKYSEIKPTNKHVILAYFGRVAKNKGIEILIQAMNRVRQKYNVCLHIWGKCDKKYLQELQMYTTQDSFIVFKGPYPDPPDYFSLMSQYDGVLFASTHSEGLPLVIVEALGCGMPILSTSYGAITESLEFSPDCILVDPDAYVKGLQIFLHKISIGWFSKRRQREFYESNYSRQKSETHWRECLADPVKFFSTSLE
jgi:glycosyltransferase involved in cell wall biosynthesis